MTNSFISFILLKENITFHSLPVHSVVKRDFAHICPIRISNLTCAKTPNSSLSSTNSSYLCCLTNGTPYSSNSGKYVESSVMLFLISYASFKSNSKFCQFYLQRISKSDNFSTALLLPL